MSQLPARRGATSVGLSTGATIRHVCRIVKRWPARIDPQDGIERGRDRLK